MPSNASPSKQDDQDKASTNDTDRLSDHDAEEFLEVNEPEKEEADAQSSEYFDPSVRLRNNLVLDIGASFIQDMVLSLGPQKLAWLYLLYDCQHFSENIITKSLNLI